MLTEVVLVRHGQTDWNLAGRIQGSKDVPLNETGIEQAEKLARRLSSESPAAIYSSDLRRAVKTAELIAAPHGLGVNQVEDLQEICFGDWEGYIFSELEKEHSEAVKQWKANSVEVGPPGGENLAQLRDRIVQAIEKIVAAHRGEKIILAVHGGVIKGLVSHYLEMPLSNLWLLEQDNAAVNRLEFYEDVVMLKLFNCVKHL